MFKDQNSSPATETVNVVEWDVAVTQFKGEYAEVMDRRAEELAMYFESATEVREISVAWGSAVHERNYRVTIGVPGNYRVSDWHIGWDSNFENIEFADEYDRIM